MQRRTLFRSGIAAAVLAMLAGGAWWLADQAAFVTTTDARVRARMVTLSAEISGRIAEMPVEAGDRIAPGQVLVRLDDEKARLELAAATLDFKAMEARIAGERLSADVVRERGGQRVAARRAAVNAAAADVTAARAVVARTQADHARASALHASGVVAQAAMDRATAALEVARQAAARAEAEAADRRAGVGEAAAEAREAEAREAEVVLGGAEAMAISAHALKQRIALLKVELKQHRVESPLAGVVDEVFAEPGEHVAAGTRLALAHGDALWIEANIKEPELPRIRVGAAVEIHFDAARGACHGVVERIGEAATSEFAVVPNANPAGVFTKITQRVPVRVKPDAACGRARPGAMATLRIRAS